MPMLSRCCMMLSKWSVHTTSSTSTFLDVEAAVVEGEGSGRIYSAITCSAAAFASGVMLETCKISLGIQPKCLRADESPFSLDMAH